jgi:hypothetical protein
VEEIMSIDRCYYVYALKDPLMTPANTFYIGKGTGSRAWEHDLAPDKSSKGLRISQIQNAGREVLISKLVDDLTEIEALRVEAELISAFGTEATEQEVGEDDGRVDAEALGGGDGDFGGDVRGAADVEEGVVAADGHVLGHVTAGLAEEPDGSAVDRLAEAGADETAGRGIGGV